jgi:hypothetical protein
MKYKSLELAIKEELNINILLFCSTKFSYTVTYVYSYRVIKTVPRWPQSNRSFPVGNCMLMQLILHLGSLGFWTSSIVRCLTSPHLRMETDPVSETLCSLLFRIPDNGQSKKSYNSSEPFRIYLFFTYSPLVFS